MKIENFKTKNQFILEDDDKVIFQSYDSKCLEYDKNTKILKVFKDYNFSKTTSKHSKMFILEKTDLKIKKLDDLKKLENVIFVD